MLVYVHEDAVFLERLLAVLLEEEVERLSERALAGGAEQVGLDLFRLCETAPYDAKILEYVFIYVFRGPQRARKLRHRGGGDVDDTRRGVRQPRVGKDLRHLGHR